MGAQDRPRNPGSKIKLLYRVRGKTATITWPTHAGLNAGRWCKGWCWGQREDRVPWALQGTQARASQGKDGKEDVHLDQEGGDGALAPEFHLHIQGKVSGLLH